MQPLSLKTSFYHFKFIKELFETVGGYQFIFIGVTASR
jgi:hypothetical protein